MLASLHLKRTGTAIQSDMSSHTSAEIPETGSPHPISITLALEVYLSKDSAALGLLPRVRRRASTALQLAEAPAKGKLTLELNAVGWALVRSWSSPISSHLVALG